MDNPLVNPDLGLIFWTTVAFLILLFILGKFAWKPILGAVNEREKSITDALAEAEKARLEMQNLKADNERILQEARAERENMMKEARELKAKMITDAKEEAQVQANKMIEHAQVAIESEKKSAMAELKSQVAVLAVEIAEKVVREELKNDQKQLNLVESMLGEATLTN